MNKRIVVVALSVCALIGIALARHAVSGPQQAELDLPQVKQLLGYTMARLAVPQQAGLPFDVNVSLGGLDLVLSLQPHSIRSADFQLLVDHGDGVLVPADAAPPNTYRGTIAGMPGGWVTASLIEGKLWATVVLDGGAAWTIEPLAGLAAVEVAPNSYAVYREQDVLPADKGCGGAIEPPIAAVPPPLPAQEGGVAGGTGFRIIELGCETDVEYWQKNGSSVPATLSDIENIINSVSAIYEAQISTTYDISVIIVRTGDVGSDPYTTSNCTELLTQFRNVWASTPENSIRRDVAHMFTGKNLSGCLGIAFVSTVCQGAGGFGYAVVESKAPGLPFSHRVGTSAHELGHNFSSPHCCCQNCCVGCSTCRIMCPCIGGCSGIVNTFGNASQTSIQNYTDGLFCLHNQPLPLVPPFFDEFPSSSLIAENWTYNSGALVNTAADNEPSPAFSLNLDAFGPGTFQFNEIRTNFIDLSGLENTGFLVQFFTQAKGVEAGERLNIDYWTGLLWQSLLVVTSDGTTETVFTEHNLTLDGLSPTPFHDEFRLRFVSNVDNTADDWYIDDVFIGGTPPPTNDSCSAPIAVGEGSFGFTTVGATTDGFPVFCTGGAGGVTFERDTWFLYTPSVTGDATFSTCNDADFDTRIAVYFEAPCPPSSPLECSDDAEGCGLTSEITLLVTPLINYLVRVGATTGGGSGTLTISMPPVEPCPWDLDGDGEVGIVDFLDLLGAWGPNPGHPADFDGDGLVGITDFLELLGNWGACP